MTHLSEEVADRWSAVLAQRTIDRIKGFSCEGMSVSYRLGRDDLERVETIVWLRRNLKSCVKALLSHDLPDMGKDQKVGQEWLAKHSPDISVDLLFETNDAPTG